MSCQSSSIPPIPTCHASGRRVCNLNVCATSVSNLAQHEVRNSPILLACSQCDVCHKARLSQEVIALDESTMKTPGYRKLYYMPTQSDRQGLCRIRSHKPFQQSRLCLKAVVKPEAS